MYSLDIGTIDEIKKLIIETVNSNGIIKEIDLVYKVLDEFFLKKNRNTNIKFIDVGAVLMLCCKENSVGSFSYTLPNNTHVKKTILFPIGTIIKLNQEV